MSNSSCATRATASAMLEKRLFARSHAFCVTEFGDWDLYSYFVGFLYWSLRYDRGKCHMSSPRMTFRTRKILAVPLPSHEEKLGKTIPILSLDFKWRVSSSLLAIANIKAEKHFGTLTGFEPMASFLALQCPTSTYPLSYEDPFIASSRGEGRKTNSPKNACVGG